MFLRHFFFAAVFFFLSSVPFFYSQEVKGEESVLAKSDIPVTALDWNPRGNTFATAWNNAVILWDARENAILAVYSEHSGPVKALHFSQDGSFLISLGQDNMIVLRNLEAEEGEVRVLGSGFAPMHDALVTDSGQSIILPKDGVFPSLYYRLRLTNKFTAHQLLETESPVAAMSLSKDEKTLLVASQDGAYSVVDVRSGAVIDSSRRYARGQLYPRISPDGSAFIAALDANSLAVSRICGEETVTIREGSQPVNCAVFSPDGTQVAYALKNGMVKVLNVFSGKTLRQYQLANQPDLVTALAFSADGSSLLVGSQAGCIMRWNISEAVPSPIVRHEPDGGKVRASLAPQAETVIMLNGLEAAGTEEEHNSIHPAAGMDGFGSGEALPAPERAENAVTLSPQELPPPGLEVALSLSSLNEDYYRLSYGLSAAWRSYSRYPLYWGGGLEAAAAAPTADYPYRYYFEGIELNNPWLYRFALFACGGICFPLPERKLLFFAEGRVGGGGNFLFNNELTYSRTSSPTGSLLCEMLMGFQWKRLRLSVGGSYDTSLGAVVKASGGLVIPLPGKQVR